MSTQPPNPQLMDRNNVAMAVAQSKSKPPSKANANASKGKMQMHRRSRTGWLLFILVPVGFPPVPSTAAPRFPPPFTTPFHTV